MRENVIQHGNFLDLAHQVDDKSIDLIIADPPYNLGKDFGNNSDTWESVKEWANWSRDWLLECSRVLKDTGSIFVYGIHRYICYIQCSMYDIGLQYGRQIIWHYENGWSQYTKAPAATYESILWFTKSNDYTYHTIREPYKSKERLKHKIIKNGKVWKPSPLGKKGGDVWKIPTLAGKRFEKEKVDHPTQKPLALCDRIIKHFSNPEDVVLVPFAGSGSECVSAISNNRKFIAFEINSEYIEIANQRLNSINFKNNRESPTLASNL